jgi:hypothetical protein
MDGIAGTRMLGGGAITIIGIPMPGIDIGTPMLGIPDQRSGKAGNSDCRPMAPSIRQHLLAGAGSGDLAEDRA